MNVAAGVEATNNSVRLIIVRGSSQQPEVLLKDELKSPKDLEKSLLGKTAHLLEVVQGAFEQHKVKAFGLKLASTTSGQAFRNRTLTPALAEHIRLEGALIGSLGSSGLLTQVGQVKAFCKAVGTTVPAEICGKGVSSWRGIQVWGRWSEDFRKVGLIAVAMLVGLEKTR